VSAAAFSHLVTGLDSLRCSHYLIQGGFSLLNWDELEAEREKLHRSKARCGKLLTLGTEQFVLARSGTAEGYPLQMENEDFHVAFGQFNSPNFVVTYRSKALWHIGAQALHQRFLEWAQSAGFISARPEIVSRADYALDYHLPVVDFSEENFVSLATGDNKWRKHKKAQTFNFGKGNIALCMYHKSDEIRESSNKTWLYPIWGQQENVWRIEARFRTDAIKKVGIRTLADLVERQGDLLRTLTHSHTTLRSMTDDSNASRWPLHPLWQDVQAQVNAMPALGVVREYDAQAYLDERELNCGIAMYGYMKRLAAIKCLQLDTSIMPLSETKKHLSQLLDTVHDEFTWQQDVAKKIQEMRLGQ
jgi:hypothetical protein